MKNGGKTPRLWLQSALAVCLGLMTIAGTPSSGAAQLPRGQVPAHAPSQKAPHTAPESVPVPAVDEPTHEITAEEERDFYLARLQASGPALNEGSRTSARALVKDWHRATRSSRRRITIDPPACYQAGCVVTTRFSSRDNFDLMTEKMAGVPSFRAWPGPKWRSGPVAHGGSVEATWVLFSATPEDGQPPPSPPHGS